MAKVRSIGVFCGSRSGRSPAYAEAARRTGEEIAKQGARLIYGGGDVGLMGIAASAAAEAGGAVRGIIPDFLIAREGQLDGVEIVIVDTMSTRKKRLIAASDAFIILPGGTGTFEEITDVISRQQLALHDKPVIFLNIEDYWAPFLALIEHSAREGFTPDDMISHIVMETDPAKAVADIVAALKAKEAA
jgi:uncharacterized protein (TIGR00730 family)